MLSLAGGFIGLENIFGKQFNPGGAEPGLSFGRQLVAPFAEAPLAASGGLLAVFLGFVAAWALYRHTSQDPLPAKLGALSVWMRNRFYFDELYQATFIRLHDSIAMVAAWIDRWVIGGGVRFTQGTTDIVGRMLRQFQTGNLQTYAFLFALGVAFLLYFVLK